jgi:hypothetical protein
MVAIVKAVLAFNRLRATGTASVIEFISSAGIGALDVWIKV